ncbi:LysR family transcriptional regulator [Jannaschia sp. Os4]|uniref:LysR family transcriptional regulator n=1 Tax=Jannaschia sp. Os4 TaxID=2807617 RepID=UPI00193A5893|nr:LysR family transcriptional regulator [Jannaschia sp. Os4]MBM2576384.1 LysR family transcriptional regulator [Jannaschia sp. Os4]
MNPSASSPGTDPDVASSYSIDDLRLFALVADAGSMSAAARRHGIAKSVLSRAVGKMEGAAGGPLFDRTHGGMVPTSLGRGLLPVANRALEVARDAQEAMRSAQGTPQGTLRIAASALSGQKIVAPAIARMAQLHPQVATTLVVTGHGPDPMEGDLDLVLRIGSPPQPYLVSRKLIASRLVPYVHRTAAARIDLNDVAAVEGMGRIVIAVEGVSADWELSDEHGNIRILRSRALVKVGDPTVALGILTAGSGVALIPEVYGGPLVRAGVLVRALPNWIGPQMEIRAVMPPRRAAIPAVAVFLDILMEHGRALAEDLVRP